MRMIGTIKKLNQHELDDWDSLLVAVNHIDDLTKHFITNSDLTKECCLENYEIVDEPHYGEIKHYDSRGSGMPAGLLGKLIHLIDLDMLKAQRDLWVVIGMCIKNVFGDSEGFQIWDQISSKQTDKYDQKVCHQQWSTFKIPNRLGVGSLHYWAKLSNPKEYTRLLKNSVQCSSSRLDNEIAESFYRLTQGTLVCFHPDIDRPGLKWYKFSQHRWMAVARDQVQRMMMVELMEKYSQIVASLTQSAALTDDDQTRGKLKADAEEFLKAKGNIQMNAKVRAACDVLASICADENFPKKLDANPYLLGLENGVLDLRTKEVRDGIPEDYISRSVGFGWNHEKTQIKNVKEYYDKMFACDKELREFMPKLIARCLIGNISTTHNIAMFLLGQKAGNSKSTFYRFLQLTLGDYVASDVSSLIFTQKEVHTSQARADLQSLIGVRFVLMSECSGKLNSTTFKSKTGDATIRIRAPYCSEKTYQIMFSLWFACNSMVDYDIDDAGMVRRIKLIRCDSTFTKNPDPGDPLQFSSDEKIGEKLQSWRQSHLTYLLDNLEEELTFPQCVESFTETTHKERDVLLDIIDDLVTVGEPKEGISFKDLKEKIRLHARYELLGATRPRDFEIAIMRKMANKGYIKKDQCQYTDSNGRLTCTKNVFMGCRLLPPTFEL